MGKKKKKGTKYPHNAHYCMIAPDEKGGDGVVSTGES